MNCKAVIFCGGRGSRINEITYKTPKPLILINRVPILMHIINHFLRHGIYEFILCLGYNANYFFEYFKNQPNVEFINSNTLILKKKYKIHLIKTGIKSSVGERLFKVKNKIINDDFFFATYGDVVTDFNLTLLKSKLKKNKKLKVSFIGVNPLNSYHLVSSNKSGVVNKISDLSTSNYWINGGYFFCRPSVFDYMRSTDEFISDTVTRMLPNKNIYMHKYKGFWYSLENYKDYLFLKKNLAKLLYNK